LGIRILILDYDMTLVNNLVDFYETFNTTLSLCGDEILTYDKFYRLYIENNLSKKIVRCSRENFWRIFRRLYRTKTGFLNRGARELLIYSRSIGLRNVIATGRECPRETVFDELRIFGVEDLVDDIYTLDRAYTRDLEEEFLFDKSDIIKKILRDYGADPDEAIFLGDYLTDYLSSIKSGVRFIGVVDNDSKKKLLENQGAKCVARDLFEAIEKIYMVKNNMC